MLILNAIFPLKYLKVIHRLERFYWKTDLEIL